MAELATTIRVTAISNQLAPKTLAFAKIYIYVIGLHRHLFGGSAQNKSGKVAVQGNSFAMCQLRQK